MNKYNIIFDACILYVFHLSAKNFLRGPAQTEVTLKDETQLNKK